LGHSDLPTEKSKIEEKIKELEKEIGEKRLEVSNNRRGLKPMERELKGLVEQKDEIKKNLTRRKNLSRIISGGTDPRIDYQGEKDKQLSTISPIEVHDYDDNGVSSDSPPTLTSDARTILDKALNYLTLLEDSTRKPPYRKTELNGSEYDQRVYIDRAAFCDS